MKTAFPETLLRQTAGLRKAGLPCVKRMPAYLQLLRVLQAEGREHVSGTVLATVHHLEPVIVRKDLAMTGAVGTPRVGFRITELIAAIERFLGWDNQTKAILVGVGNLGAALLGYRGFADFGFQIVAAIPVGPLVMVAVRAAINAPRRRRRNLRGHVSFERIDFILRHRPAQAVNGHGCADGADNNRKRRYSDIHVQLC